MSLLLDVVLFIRKNASALKLSPLERIVLITLAGRIGQNETTWVRQEILADECLIKRRHLIRILNSLKDRNLINTQKIGRNLTYTLSLENMSCETHIVKENVSYKTPINDNTCPTGHLNTCPTEPVLPQEKSPQTHVAVGLPDIPILPKVKDENKHIIKVKEKRVLKKEENDQILPDWLPQEDWKEYVQFRKEINKPLGKVATKRAISALARLRDTGQDISKVIDQSIVHGWQGLFPLKGVNYAQSGSNSKLSPHQASLKRGWDVVNNWH